MKRFIVLIALFVWFSCTTKMLKFNQYSLSMNLMVAADSSVVIGTDDHFFGVLRLDPILETEQVAVEKIKLIQNYGRYFVCAENFKNVWMIEPNDDGMTGQYTAIDVTPEDKTDAYQTIVFSRYGAGENICVKFGFNNKQVVIDRKGNVHEKCGK